MSQKGVRWDVWALIVPLRPGLNTTKATIHGTFMTHRQGNNRDFLESYGLN